MNVKLKGLNWETNMQDALIIFGALSAAGMILGVSLAMAAVAGVAADVLLERFRKDDSRIKVSLRGQGL